MAEEALFYEGQILKNYEKFDEVLRTYEKTTKFRCSIADCKENKSPDKEKFMYLYKVIKCPKSGAFKSKGQFKRPKP